MREGNYALGKMLQSFEDVTAKIPEARRKALEAAAKAVQEDLNREIVQRLPNHDARGRVRSWQEVAIGTRGGYAAVTRTPKSRSERVNQQSTWATVKRALRGQSAKKVYTGYEITKWLEKGHEIANQYGRAGFNTEGATVVAKKGPYGGTTYSFSRGRTVMSKSTGNAVAPGFMFYSWTKSSADKLALEAAQQVLEEVKRTLEG
jgi:hypothetical protein